METKELEIIENKNVLLQSTASIKNVVEQMEAIQGLMRSVMKIDLHFGTIEGTEKPTLYKAGAEKLNVMFRLYPAYKEDIEELGNGHIRANYVCELFHIDTGKKWGEGIATCSTMETKFRYRYKKSTCPSCGADAVTKGKEEYGGGWFCWKKLGGCGETFDNAFGEESGFGKQEKIENPDIADVWNTVKKIGAKRAFVAATINCTGCSDIFNQDIGDKDENNNKNEKGITPNQKPEQTQQTRMEKVIQDEPDPGQPLPGSKIMQNKVMDLPQDIRDDLKNLGYNTVRKQFDYCERLKWDSDAILDGINFMKSDKKDELLKR